LTPMPSIICSSSLKPLSCVPVRSTARPAFCYSCLELVLDELWPDVLERAEALRDRIQLTVKSEMPDQFDAIKSLTDEAIDELKVWYG
jgi:hypothetical protein